MTKQLIDNLYAQVIMTGAKEAHVEIGGIVDKPNTIAVISVYRNQRPANKVLDDLYDWAEESGNTELVDKIQELDRLEGDSDD